MENIEFSALPHIRFAHVYSKETYRATFSTSRDFIEFTYLSKGMLIREDSEGKQVIRKGDVMCSYFSMPFSVKSDQFHEHHTVGVRIPFTILPNNTKGLLLPFLTPAELHTQKACSIIDEIISKKHVYMESSAHCAAKIFELACEIDKCNRSKANLPGELFHAQRAKAYIHENITQPLTQREISEYLSISPEYLCTTFKKAEGVTLMRYINTVKLQAIQALMERENVHLYEATTLYGYRDPNYVSRLFKRYFGYNITDKLK